jgi:N-methylhydantoinase A
LRIAIDIGGTFTDLVVEESGGGFRLYKSPTSPADPAAGALAAIELAAADLGVGLEDFLAQAELLIHGTTRGLNAILTGDLARTALVTTRGHPDILLFREGGRREPFNNTRRYPPPYVPRRFTYEMTERIGSDGRVLIAFDAEDAVRVIERMAADRIEAVAVCFLWSVVNAAHELKFGSLLDQHMPGIPYTLSHQLNPAIREYRRASSAAIDVSLKPLISEYLTELSRRLRTAGFRGRPLMVTSGGGLLDFEDVVKAPIHSLGSGPAMAPVAGRHFGRLETQLANAIVADAGGTSYDVSLVRKGRIPLTRESWIGEEFAGHITGFPSIDVKSIGAGGGSIAWVDDGGLLHVGPESAGADPGPACYGRGFTRPTLTDACLVLGYLNPRNFLGGRLGLDPAAAAQAIDQHVAQPLGLDVTRGAYAVLEVMTEQMAQAVEEVSVRQGVAPASAALVAGGGSSGFNCVAIARRVRSPLVLIPEVAAGLSAAGALLSDLTSEVRETFPATTSRFATSAVNEVLARLRERSERFLTGPAAGSNATSIEYFAEARYPDQVWELEVALRSDSFASVDDVETLRADFHATHRESFAVADEGSAVEIITWGARARGSLRRSADPAAGGEQARTSAAPPPSSRRQVYFAGGWIDCGVHALEGIPMHATMVGPAIIESPSTTIVLPESAALRRTGLGSLLITPTAAESAA